MEVSDTEPLLLTVLQLGLKYPLVKQVLELLIRQIDTDL